MTMVLDDGREVGQRRYLIAILREGWHYDPRRRWITRGDQHISLKDVLPRNSRITLLAPDLAKRQPGSLAPDESVLASTLNIFLPKQEVPDKFLDAIDKLDCVDKAWLSPEVGLPGF